MVSKSYNVKIDHAQGWGDKGPQPTGPSETLQETEVINSNICWAIKQLSIQVPIVNPSECLKGEHKEGSIVCAGGSGSGGCQGDSGGPLTVEVSGRRVLVGVLSHGTPVGVGCSQVTCCHCELLSIPSMPSNPLMCSWTCSTISHG